MQKEIRAFIALEISSELQEELKEIQKQLMQLPGEIAWIRPENLHISIRFLGDITQEQVNIIVQINEKIAKKLKSFPISLSVLGVFPYISDPHILWAGIGSGYSQVTQINTLVSNELSSMKLKYEDKHFHPHITLARIKSIKNKSELAEMIDKIKLRIASEEISKLILYKSETTPKGAIYTKISEVQLGKI
ncbi:MAG: RNA 2',3'-cyclic phosphodiesterase [Candidatus Omnitrophota bacterium]